MCICAYVYICMHINREEGIFGSDKGGNMNYDIKKMQENAGLQHAACECQGRRRSPCLLFPGCPSCTPHKPGGSGPAQGMAGADQPPGSAAMAPQRRGGGLGSLLCSSSNRLGCPSSALDRLLVLQQEQGVIWFSGFSFCLGRMK